MPENRMSPRHPIKKRLRIALATYEQAPGLAPDDRTLIPALDRFGIDAVAAVWSRDREWHRFDGVVIRSCWDYHRRAGEFLSWLDGLAASNVPTWNSRALVRWNADKRYLLALAERGVATVPTVIASTVDEVTRGAADRGWKRFVVKPAVSASGHETHALTLPLDEAAMVSVSRAVALGDVLVQPFVDEVERDGEYSFSFIEGELSHAALKRAAAGDFRVQTEYGGTVSRVDAPSDLAGQAASALGALSETPLYARVDGVARDGRLLLTELELIEPNLFLEHAPGASTRLAGAIARRLASTR
jgi:glutathione synthase/RimK-type ligase-like ATP-grasp enzyme